MYNPASFEITDTAQICRFIESHPLGLLISHGTNGISVSLLPFMLREHTLIAHLARANPHWQALKTAETCVVVFQGAQNYVTPNWYPSKASTHRVVPTWNYEMVEITGQPTVIDDPQWLRDQATTLTEHMERSRPDPWQASDAPEDYLASQLRGIVGLSIRITAMQGKSKMSQNRPHPDQAGVATGMADPADPHHNPMITQIIRTRLAAR